MKSRQKLFSGYLKIPVIIVSAVLLGACGGGGGGGTVAAPADNQVAKTTVPVTSASTSSVSSVPSAPATGKISLAWTAPAARANGTPLSLADISGYRIYYGTSSGKYTNSANVPDGTATSATVTGIPAGASYYLVMTTYDVNGLESGYSQAVRKTAL